MTRCRHCNKVVQDGATTCPFCKKALGTPQTKNCPYCAEDIQAAAIVCKHCGRELEASPSHAPVPQTVVVEQREGCFLQTLNAGCGIVGGVILAAVLAVVGILMLGFCSTRFASKPTPSPQATTQAELGPEKAGRFRAYKYTYRKQGGNTVFLFEPPMPMDDDVVIAAMRHVLEREFAANLNRATTRQAGVALRFITASGAFDVTPVKNEHNQVMGLTVTRPE